MVRVRGSRTPLTKVTDAGIRREGSSSCQTVAGSPLRTNGAASWPDVDEDAEGIDPDDVEDRQGALGRAGRGGDERARVDVPGRDDAVERRRDLGVVLDRDRPRQPLVRDPRGGHGVVAVLLGDDAARRQVRGAVGVDLRDLLAPPRRIDVAVGLGGVDDGEQLPLRHLLSALDGHGPHVPADLGVERRLFEAADVSRQRDRPLRRRRLDARHRDPHPVRVLLAERRALVRLVRAPQEEQRDHGDRREDDEEHRRDPDVPCGVR